MKEKKNSFENLKKDGQSEFTLLKVAFLENGRI